METDASYCIDLWWTGEYWEISTKDVNTDENLSFKTADSFEEMIEILREIENGRTGEWYSE